ncbi:MAG: hypothetical protein ACRDTF_10055 [Pseudonocardiaceae bacterium]
MLDDPRGQAGDAAARLRVVLAAIDAGELEATDVQRAHLAGSVVALEWITGERREHSSLRDTSF